jgi:hypothetical protein
MRRILAALALCLMAAGCAAQLTPPHSAANAAGLVALPCAERGVLRPVDQLYCRQGHNFIVPAGYDTLSDVAVKLARAHAGARLTYLEASWASGQMPMPIIAHGDGHQVDLALFYQTRSGVRMKGPPPTGRKSGYGAYEPPLHETDRACPDRAAHGKDRPDPPADRKWRMDETRTKTLVRLLVDDPRVRQVIVEPHLKARLGFSAEPKVTFAGCGSVRVDDHIHVDFF